MLNTLKTYAGEVKNFSFILSYAEESGAGATLSLFEKSTGVTVDLTPADLKALSDAVSTAYYSTLPTSA